MTEILPRWIRSTHPYAYRSGTWAALSSVHQHKGRDCYLVRFPDGASDWWVVNDPCARYEFSDARLRPLEAA